MTKTKISQEIKKIREGLGLNQRDFAKKFGVQGSTVWRWETGRMAPNAKAMDALAALRSSARGEPAGVSGSTDEVDEVKTESTDTQRCVGLNDLPAEVALLHSTAAITAAWIANRRIQTEPKEVMEFIKQTTRALKQE